MLIYNDRLLLQLFVQLVQHSALCTARLRPAWVVGVWYACSAACDAWRICVQARRAMRRAMW